MLSSVTSYEEQRTTIRSFCRDRNWVWRSDLMNGARKIFVAVWLQRAESLSRRLRFIVCNTGILWDFVLLYENRYKLNIWNITVLNWTIYSTLAYIFQLTTKSDGAKLQHLTRNFTAHNYNFSFQLFVEKINGKNRMVMKVRPYRSTCKDKRSINSSCNNELFGVLLVTDLVTPILVCFLSMSKQYFVFHHFFVSALAPKKWSAITKALKFWPLAPGAKALTDGWSAIS